MLDKLKQLLQRELLNDGDEADSAHFSVKVAAAALMIEVISADYDFKDEERTLLLSILKNAFHSRTMKQISC